MAIAVRRLCYVFSVLSLRRPNLDFLIDFD